MFMQRFVRDIPSGVLFDTTGYHLEPWCVSRGVRPSWLDIINERARRKGKR